MADDMTIKRIKALVDEELGAMFDALSEIIFIQSNTETAIRAAIVKELVATGHLNAADFTDRLRKLRDTIASTKYSETFDLSKFDGMIDLLVKPDGTARPTWLRGVLEGDHTKRDQGSDDA